MSKTEEKKSLRGSRKKVTGVVTSNKMDKTISVRTTNLVQHQRYKKFIKRVTTYKAHDEENDAREGDLVEIMECKRYSKSKSWRLTKVIRRAPER